MHELPFKYKVNILRSLPSHLTPPCTSKNTWKHSQHLDWFKLRLLDAYPKTEKYRKTFMNFQLVKTMPSIHSCYF
jgi:hypothetical protein